MAMLTNGMCTNQNLSKKMRPKKFYFEIQTDRPTPAKRTPDLVLIKKKMTDQLVDFVILVDHRVIIKENEKILGPCLRAETTTTVLLHNNKKLTNKLI